jgi:uncharacterized protein (DUF302 family)
MPQPLGFEVELPVAFDAAVGRVKDALTHEGFGVLTEIDLRSAFREKLGRDFRPYVILGACNPTLAYTAVTADASVGSLLPCNVTVESVGDARTVVRLTNPEALLSSAATASSPELATVARDGRERMERATAALKRGT